MTPDKFIYPPLSPILNRTYSPCHTTESNFTLYVFFTQTFFLLLKYASLCSLVEGFLLIVVLKVGTRYTPIRFIKSNILFWFKGRRT